MHLADHTLPMMSAPQRPDPWGFGTLGGWKSYSFEGETGGYSAEIEIVRSEEHRCNNDASIHHAAELHTRDMEERQRKILGNEYLDGHSACPLCVEKMDPTDLSFLPCDCGYQVCLLCFSRIQKEGSMQCPACRNTYEEAKFRTVPSAQAPPPAPAPARASSSSNASAAHTRRGWESATGAATVVSTGASSHGAAAKKSPPPQEKPERKAALLPSPVIVQDPRVEDMLEWCAELGVLSPGELDTNVQLALKNMDASDAESVLSEFLKKDMAKVRNKSAFLHGIITRYAIEDETLASSLANLSSEAGPSRLGPRGSEAGSSPPKGQGHSQLQGRVSRVLTMADAAGLPHALLQSRPRC